MKELVTEEKPKQRYKQAIILRKDLKMGCGKACAQAAHASLEAVRCICDAQEDERDGLLRAFMVDEWEKQGYHKVVLAVHSEKELSDIYIDALNLGIPAAEIVDFGLTQLEPGTKTAVGIGPSRAEDVDKITKHLKLY